MIHVYIAPIWLISRKSISSNALYEWLSKQLSLTTAPSIWILWKYWNSGNHERRLISNFVLTLRISCFLSRRRSMKTCHWHWINSRPTDIELKVKLELISVIYNHLTQEIKKVSMYTKLEYSIETRSREWVVVMNLESLTLPKFRRTKKISFSSNRSHISFGGTNMDVKFSKLTATFPFK